MLMFLGFYFVWTSVLILIYTMSLAKSRWHC